MNQFEVVKYNSDYFSSWNEFIARSKNATFLFDRNFMEYHKDRFEDYSLLIFQNKKIVCIVPAHRNGNRFCSHLGLTYGGFIFAENEKVAVIKSVFESVETFLRKNNFTEMLLKLLPSIYTNRYSSAVDYFLFQKNAELIRRDMNFAVDLQQEIQMHKKKRKILQKDYVDELEIKEDGNYEVFWIQVLQPVLKERFDAEPVHSLEEIKKLAAAFSENIKQFNIYHQEKIIAGMTLFIDNGVVKSQYGAVNEAGKEFRALDVLYLFLFKTYKAEGMRYFDLGITNEADGYTYNEGLTNYKEELGGLPINQDRYLLKL